LHLAWINISPKTELIPSRKLGGLPSRSSANQKPSLLTAERPERRRNTAQYKGHIVGLMAHAFRWDQHCLLFAPGSFEKLKGYARKHLLAKFLQCGASLVSVEVQLTILKTEDTSHTYTQE
jgi:hypothetical protein